MRSNLSGDLWACFAETVRRHSTHTAFIHGDTSTSFDQWMDRSLDYVHYFSEAGARPGDRVLLTLPNSSEMAAAMCGVWGAGGVPVLVHPESTDEQIRHVVDLVEPARVVEAESGGGGSPSELICHPTDVGSAPRSQHVGTHAAPSEPASIVFTSGSTGPPKGVVQSHGNLIRGCHAVASSLGYREGDRIIAPIPWSFDYGFGQLLITVVGGVPQVLPQSPRPMDVCDAIARHRPTVLAGIPSLFGFLLQGLSPIRETDLSSLRLLTNTGGSIAPSVWSGMLEVFDGCEISLNYGLTESYRTSCLDPSLAIEHPTSVGTAIVGAEVAVIRADGTEAAPEEEGEIVHRGDFVFLEYFNDREATEAARRPDPLAPPGTPDASPVLYTGDFGRRDAEGLLYVHGRRDRRLKSMGVRVCPEEIEQVLLRSGLLHEVAIFGQRHDLIGDEIWCAAVAAPGESDIQTRLSAYAREVLTPFMMPRRFLFMAELPRTSTGKIDYAALEGEAALNPSASILRAAPTSVAPASGATIVDDAAARSTTPTEGAQS